MQYIPICSKTRTEFQILLNDWIANVNEECSNKVIAFNFISSIDSLILILISKLSVI